MVCAIIAVDPAVFGMCVCDPSLPRILTRTDTHGFTAPIKTWNDSVETIKSLLGRTCFPDFLKFLESRTSSTCSEFSPNFWTPRKRHNLLVVSVVSVVNGENLIVSVPFLVQNMSFVRRVSIVRQLTIFLPKSQNEKFAKIPGNKYDQQFPVVVQYHC